MIKLKYILLFFLALLVVLAVVGIGAGMVIDPTTKSGLANIKFLVGGFGVMIFIVAYCCINFNYFRICLLFLYQVFQIMFLDP